jgi:biotin operon repressor
MLRELDLTDNYPVYSNFASHPPPIGGIMSFQAMAWAITQDIPRTSEKFLLVMLANYADKGGYCYPSIERLALELSQNRKTVIKSIKSLMSAGLLRDTGRRVGHTKSVVVYQLMGIPSASQFHYVYRIENPETGEYYIGTRSTNVLPHIDEYRGSGDWCKEIREKNIFTTREVVQVFSTAEECRAYESRFFRSMDYDDGLCRNKQTRFHMRKIGYEREEQFKAKVETDRTKLSPDEFRFMYGPQVEDIPFLE